MNKPTLSNLDRELKDTQDKIALQKIAARMNIERQVTKDTKLAKKLFEKTQTPRVRKPKPKRRLKNRVAPHSHRGENIEDENDFKTVS